MKKKTMLDLHRVNVQQYASVAKIPLTVVLDDVRSEMNVGSIFRTADAFVVERVCLCGITSVLCRSPGRAMPWCWATRCAAWRKTWSMRAIVAWNCRNAAPSTRSMWPIQPP